MNDFFSYQFSLIMLIIVVNYDFSLFPILIFCHSLKFSLSVNCLPEFCGWSKFSWLSVRLVSLVTVKCDTVCESFHCTWADCPPSPPVPPLQDPAAAEWRPPPAALPHHPQDGGHGDGVWDQPPLHAGGDGSHARRPGEDERQVPQVTSLTSLISWAHYQCYGKHSCHLATRIIFHSVTPHNSLPLPTSLSSETERWNEYLPRQSIFNESDQSCWINESLGICLCS